MKINGPKELKEQVIDAAVSKGLNLQVTINGKLPNRFEESTVEQIVKKDTFLKHYTVKEVQFGLIDQKKAAGVQPVPKTYDAQANVIDRVNEQQRSRRMK